MEKGFRLLLIAAILVVISLGLSVYKKSKNIADVNLDKKVITDVSNSANDNNVAVDKQAEVTDINNPLNDEKTSVVDKQNEIENSPEVAVAEKDLEAKASIKPMVSDE